MECHLRSAELLTAAIFLDATVFFKPPNLFDAYIFVYDALFGYRPAVSCTVAVLPF
jgi:hypothetical protein